MHLVLSLNVRNMSMVVVRHCRRLRRCRYGTRECILKKNSISDHYAVVTACTVAHKENVLIAQADNNISIPTLAHTSIYF